MNMSVEIVGSNFNCIMKNCCTINYFQILTVISSHKCTKVQYCFNIVNLFYQTYGCMRPNQRVLFFCILTVLQKQKQSYVSFFCHFTCFKNLFLYCFDFLLNMKNLVSDIHKLSC